MESATRRGRASLLKVEDVASILNVKSFRVYELIRLGLLPAVRLGRQVRVDTDQLDSWIAAGGQEYHDGLSR